jgi:hypothetical protein
MPKMIISDGIINPFVKNGESPLDIKTIKLSFSSYKKESAETAYLFALKLESPILNVIGFNFRRINYTYARTGVIHCAYLQFNNLPLGDVCKTMNDESYVASIPIQDGTGTILGSYAFQSDYVVMLKNEISKLNRLNIAVVKEDSTNDGFFIPFSDLTYLQVEVDVLYLDNRIKQH